MGRIVSLEDKKNTVTIEIGGASFDISRVVLAVHDMYNEYLEAITEYHESTQGDRETPVVKRVRQFIDIRKKYVVPIMQLLLEKNGYVYDDDWWRQNVESYDHMDEFIRACLMKDVDDKKKELPESLTATE